jgi:soluble lytic murein transglycosylase
MSRWNDISYFEDTLERLSRGLTAGRQWNTLKEIFSALEKRNALAPLAQYAWILGRAIQEGYFKTERSAESFFGIAYNDESPLYYRVMAAATTGERFTPFDSTTEKTTAEKEDNNEAEFLLGFFEYGASALALPFIQKSENELSPPELRKIAEALAASERWKECLDLVSRYIRRKDYIPNEKDFHLFYPRPFGELVKKYAKKAELGPELLYGLIRTESYFESSIVSRSGAVGLTQLMAPTAKDMANRIARRGGPDYRNAGGTVDLDDPETNIHIGSWYLRYLVEYMKSPMPAILAYNGGMGRVRRWLAADETKSPLPHDLFLETVEYPETRAYGRNVLAAAAVYGSLYYRKNAENIVKNIYPAEDHPADKYPLD